MFATGELYDNPDGLFMAGTGRLLRWVAVTGQIGDWCVYCHFAEHNEMWIAAHGDKVGMKQHIQRCVPCDEEAFARYRY